MSLSEPRKGPEIDYAQERTDNLPLSIPSNSLRSRALRQKTRRAPLTTPAWSQALYCWFSQT